MAAANSNIAMVCRHECGAFILNDGDRINVYIIYTIETIHIHCIVYFVYTTHDDGFWWE